MEPGGFWPVWEPPSYRWTCQGTLRFNRWYGDSYRFIFRFDGSRCFCGFRLSGQEETELGLYSGNGLLCVRRIDFLISTGVVEHSISCICPLLQLQGDECNN